MVRNQLTKRMSEMIFLTSANKVALSLLKLGFKDSFCRQIRQESNKLSMLRDKVP